MCMYTIQTYKVHEYTRIILHMQHTLTHSHTHSLACTVLSSTYRRMVEDEQAGSSDDEIFTVSSKPRHMPSEAGWSDSAAHAEAAPDQAADVGRQGEVETKRVSKRSMKKIKVNGGNGTRVVFDEETGEALNPLVQLMRSGLGSKYVEGDRDTVTPEQHAAAIKQRIAASDMDDKAAFRQRQKDNKLALKIKLKKMLSRTDEEDQDGPAQLGGAASSEAETSEDDGSNDDDAQGAASDEASGAWNLGASSKDAKRKGEQIAAGSALKKKRKAGSGNGDGEIICVCARACVHVWGHGEVGGLTWVVG